MCSQISRLKRVLSNIKWSNLFSMLFKVPNPAKELQKTQDQALSCFHVPKVALNNYTQAQWWFSVQRTIELTWQRTQRPLQSGDNTVESTQKTELLWIQKDCSTSAIHLRCTHFSKAWNNSKRVQQTDLHNNTLRLCQSIAQWKY